MNDRLSQRNFTNSVMLGLVVLATILALVPLFGVLGYVLVNGLPALNLAFLTSLPAPVGQTGGGMANGIVGTLILVALASVIGIPIGIFAGIYLSEFGKGKLGDFIRFITDLLMGVPSIIVGLFVYTYIVLAFGGFSAIAGGIALGILMIPAVTRTTEEMLKLVPQSIREAGLALGLPNWKVILRIVLPTARRGIVTGIMLAIARVAGETAPLLFTAFGNRYWSFDITEPMASLPVLIFTYAISPYKEWQAQAWAGALTLILLVLILSVTARVLSARK